MMEAIARSARILAGAFVIALLISAAATPSRAQIMISDQFNFSDTYGVNPVGNGAPIGSTGFYQGGTYDSVGADSVTPSAGTTVTATQATVTYNLRARQVTIESGRAAKAARRLRLSAAVRAIVSFRVLTRLMQRFDNFAFVSGVLA